MKRNNWQKIVSTVIALIFVTWATAQSKYEGDQLVGLLGKAAESSELSTLKNSYQMQMANETHYLSTQGIELILQLGVLHEIQLYRNSGAYGQFTNALPRGLRFGMTATEVKKIMGKPTVVYNSTGYLEFEWDMLYIYSCSFENGQLNQVSIGLK